MRNDRYPSFFPVPAWDDLPLVKLLEAPYDAALNRVCTCVAPLLGTRPLGGEEYTDHDLNHSARVVQRIGAVLPNRGRELNQPELYIVLLAALLHDAGMWTSREEAEQLRSDPQFRKHCQDHWPDKLDQVDDAMGSDRRRWMGTLGLQILAASYNRKHHADRLGTFVIDGSSPTGQTLRVLVSDDFVEAVVAVSTAHSWDREDVLENDALRPREFGPSSDLADLRFLAILLRLGDLLDLGEGRVSSLLWDYLRPLDPVSESHWRKESKLRMERCEPALIQISGQFDIDTHGIKEREAYRLAIEWLNWLEDETRTAHHYLSVMEPQFSDRLRLDALRVDRTRVKATGLAIEGRVSFELDRERVMRLLGDEIYSEGCIFVRELLQNAVDATRSQMIRDHKARIEKHDPAFPPDRPWHWPAEVTGRYSIEINTGAETIDAKEYTLFSIVDHGVGMTLKQISDYFLQVGVSYYKTDEFKEEFTFSSISHFGIGFLSCLIVADRIEVVTRTQDEQTGLRLSIQSPSDHFLVEKVEAESDVPQGTRVTLWIDPAKLRAGDWNAMPINDDDAMRAIGAPSGDAGDFAAAAAAQWGPFLEFPVSINAEPYGPRRVGKLVLSLTGDRWYDVPKDAETASIPVRVLSPSGDQIADACFAFNVVPPSRIPFIAVGIYESDFEDAVEQIIGSRGMYLHAYHDGKSLLAVNYNLLPRRSLTAGHQLRRNVLPTSPLAGLLMRRLFAETFEQIKVRSLEAAALWRLTVRIRQASTVVPLLLPCRTAQGMEWLTLDKAKSRHKRLILVPFGVAWYGDWTIDIPCLGILNLDMEQRYGTRELTSDRSLDELPLIAVDGICTGYLWPKGSSTRVLPRFKGQATFLRRGAVRLTGERGGGATAISIDSRLVQPGELPDYDKSGSPWEKYGLSDVFSGSASNEVSERAQQVLREIPPVSFSNVEWEIILEDTDDWE